MGRKRTKLRERYCFECGHTFNLNEMLMPDKRCPQCEGLHHAAVTDEGIGKSVIENQQPTPWLKKEDLNNVIDKREAHKVEIQDLPTLKNKSEAKTCVYCNRPEYLIDLRSLTTPSYPTENPNENAEIISFDPEEKIDICNECMPEYLKHNGLRLQVPQLVRKYPKIGRNELCPCGSGKKYKNCHISAGHNTKVPIEYLKQVFNQDEEKQKETMESKSEGQS